MLAAMCEAEGDDEAAAAVRSGAGGPAVAAAMVCREAWGRAHGFRPPLAGEGGASDAVWGPLSGSGPGMLAGWERGGGGWADRAMAAGLQAAVGGEAGAAALAAWGIGAVELADAAADGAGGRASGGPLDLEATFRMTWPTEMASPDHPVRAALLGLVREMSPAECASFLHFVTGSGCVPPPGAEALEVQIPAFAASADDWRRQLRLLPQAHTCANTLELPDYLGAVRSLAGELGLGSGDAEAAGRYAAATLRVRVGTALSLGGADAYGLDDDAGAGSDDDASSDGSADGAATAASAARRQAGVVSGTGRAGTVGIGRPALHEAASESSERDAGVGVVVLPAGAASGSGPSGRDRFGVTAGAKLHGALGGGSGLVAESRLTSGGLSDDTGEARQRTSSSAVFPAGVVPALVGPQSQEIARGSGVSRAASVAPKEEPLFDWG